MDCTLKYFQFGHARFKTLYLTSSSMKSLTLYLFHMSPLHQMLLILALHQIFSMLEQTTLSSQVKTLLTPTPLWGRLRLLTNGDFAPFVGLTHRAIEKLGVPKDGLRGVIWPGIQYGIEMFL